MKQLKVSLKNEDLQGSQSTYDVSWVLLALLRAVFFLQVGGAGDVVDGVLFESRGQLLVT